MLKQLNQNMKAKFTPIVLERDYLNGETPYCFYCKGGFVTYNKYWIKVWDHLNNNSEDSRVENLVWAHSYCNAMKKTDADFQIMAREKLKQNVSWAQVEGTGERERGSHTDTEELTDAEVGKTTDRITKIFLDERLKGQNKKEFLPRKDTRDCITLLIKKETNGRGSQQAVDRAIDNYCCSIGEYISPREDGKRIIRIRKEGEKL
jgi:hypothetical protein